jgi:hypothetical protein
LNRACGKETQRERKDEAKTSFHNVLLVCDRSRLSVSSPECMTRLLTCVRDCFPATAPLGYARGKAKPMCS